MDSFGSADLENATDPGITAAALGTEIKVGDEVQRVRICSKKGSNDDTVRMMSTIFACPLLMDNETLRTQDFGQY
jgi:hypothetical protein